MSIDRLASLDPQLPALRAAFEVAAVVRGFERLSPGAENGRTTRVVACTLHDAVYEPGLRAVVTYALRVRKTGERLRSTFCVVDVTPDGIRYRVFEEDPALPGLVVATDGEMIRERLAEATGRPAIRCSVTPIRYRPGDHCVVRYELDAPNGVEVLFGKVVAADPVGLAVTLDSLHAAAADTRCLEIGPARAVFVDLHLVVQHAARGTDLSALVFGGSRPQAARLEALHQAGRCLGALHACAGPHRPKRTLQQDLADVYALLPAVAQADPALASRLSGAADDMCAHPASTQAFVPSHGSFRADHVLLDGDHATLIDLDGYCSADPARDAGNLLAYTGWRALREPRHGLDLGEGRSVFLAGYASQGFALEPERLRLFEAASMLKIAARRFRRLAVTEWPVVPALVDAAVEQFTLVRQ
ncbi:MAG: aminoglycoside phosphotransferase family protein [Actinomycetota bacterium]|nr:aminoglycoside phosphotransferase family protein [Actinomycetota bacterium]